MKKWIIKSNSWYDALNEPKKFLTFALPAMFLIGLMSFGGIILKMIGIVGILILLIWRMLGKCID